MCITIKSTFFMFASNGSFEFQKTLPLAFGMRRSICILTLHGQVPRACMHTYIHPSGHGYEKALARPA